MSFVSPSTAALSTSNLKIVAAALRNTDRSLSCRPISRSQRVEDLFSVKLTASIVTFDINVVQQREVRRCCMDGWDIRRKHGRAPLVINLKSLCFWFHLCKYSQAM